MVICEKIVGNEPDFVDSTDRGMDMSVRQVVDLHNRAIYNQYHLDALLALDVMDYV